MTYRHSCLLLALQQWRMWEQRPPQTASRTVFGEVGPMQRRHSVKLSKSHRLALQRSSWVEAVVCVLSPAALGHRRQILGLESGASVRERLRGGVSPTERSRSWWRSDLGSGEGTSNPLVRTVFLEVWAPMWWWIWNKEWTGSPGFRRW
jgi:hypothetical protein